VTLRPLERVDEVLAGLAAGQIDGSVVLDPAV
jgi:hypothetical protein